MLVFEKILCTIIPCLKFCKGSLYGENPAQTELISTQLTKWTFVEKSNIFTCRSFSTLLSFLMLNSNSNSNSRSAGANAGCF